MANVVNFRFTFEQSTFRCAPGTPQLRETVPRSHRFRPRHAPVICLVASPTISSRYASVVLPGLSDSMTVGSAVRSVRLAVPGPVAADEMIDHDAVRGFVDASKNSEGRAIGSSGRHGDDAVYALLLESCGCIQAFAEPSSGVAVKPSMRLAVCLDADVHAHVASLGSSRICVSYADTR